jgi:uncharacterized membrane protein YqjE
MALGAQPSPPGRPGLLASLREVCAALAALIHSRVELVTRELERERVRVTRLALIAAVALFFFFLGTLTLTLFVIVLFWDSQRLVAIGALTVLYLGIAVGLALYAKSEAGRAARPFAATVAAFKEDRKRLKS